MAPGMAARSAEEARASGGDGPHRLYVDPSILSVDTSRCLRVRRYIALLPIQGRC